MLACKPIYYLSESVVLTTFVKKRTVKINRITSSLFGQVLQRKEQTPPDSLVLQILQQKQFTTPATQWGVSNESRAWEEYIQRQLICGKDGLVVAPAGFFISKSQPFLGASPDGAVFDPSSPNHPFGFLEIKSSFKHKNVTPQEACHDPTFCCTYSVVEVFILSTENNLFTYFPLPHH